MKRKAVLHKRTRLGSCIIVFTLLSALLLLLPAAVSAQGEEPPFLLKWGSYGSGNGQFNRPVGVAVNSLGNVYVADAHNNRIQKFTSEGAFITKWGGLGTTNGKFNRPVGVAVNSDGYVYVSDMLNNRIQKFDSDGDFIAKWGSSGSGDGQFQYPFGVAVDRWVNIYVADVYNYRIQVFGIASPEILRCTVERFYNEEQIDNPGIYDSLLQQLDAAIEKIDKGQEKPAKNILNAFINHVRAQAGKHIAQEAAEDLIAKAQYVISRL